MERAVRRASRSRSRPGGTATTVDAGARPSSTRIGYPVLVRPCYVLGGRAMQIVYDDDDLRAAMAELAGFGQPRPARAACRPSARCWSTASSRTPSRSTSTPSATPPARCSSAASWSTSRRPACTRGDSRLRDPAADAVGRGVVEVIEAYTRAHRRRARRPRPDQRAVRGEGEPGLRDRGQPARQPHGAVRGQGHRRAAGEGRGPGDGRRDARRAARRGPAAAAGRPAATSR